MRSGTFFVLFLSFCSSSSNHWLAHFCFSLLDAQFSERICRTPEVLRKSEPREGSARVALFQPLSPHAGPLAEPQRSETGQRADTDMSRMGRECAKAKKEAGALWAHGGISAVSSVQQGH